MKYSILAIAILAALPSCKKTDNKPFVPEDDPYRNLCPVGYDEHVLTGKWRRLVTYNGFSGQAEVAPANQYMVLTLSANNSYTTTVNGNVTEAGTYHTATITSQVLNQPVLALYLSGHASYAMVNTYHDSLTLSADVYDGGGTLYRRDCR